MIRHKWDLPGHRWKPLLPVTKVRVCQVGRGLGGGPQGASGRTGTTPNSLTGKRMSL